MDKKERNYCCLVLLLNRVGLVKLRHFFIYQWDSCSGCLPWTDSSQNGADLLIKYTPLHYERDKVKSGDTTTWDLSLFVKTLLYSKPPLVPSYETALVDGLKYLKDTRNLLGHTQNGKIESLQFQDLFKDACNALKLLGASKNDFTQVENDVQRPWNEVLSMVKKCTSQDADILQGIDTLNSSLDVVKTKLYNVHHSQEQSQIRQVEMQERVVGLENGLVELKWDQWQGQENIKHEIEELKQLIKNLGTSNLNQDQIFTQQELEEMNCQLIQIQNQESSDKSCQKQKKIKKDRSLITRAKDKLKQRIKRPAASDVPELESDPGFNCLWIPDINAQPVPVLEETWPSGCLLKDVPYNLQEQIIIAISNVNPPLQVGWREIGQELGLESHELDGIESFESQLRGSQLLKVLGSQQPTLTLTEFVKALITIKRNDIVDCIKQFFLENND